MTLRCVLSGSPARCGTWSVWAAPEKRSGYLKEAADAQGIEIRQDEDLISITLPGLLPKRKRTSTLPFSMSR